MTPDHSAGSGLPRAESRGERWARVRELFEQALDRPAPQRDAWIAVVAGSDRELADEVHALLRVHDTAGDFLEHPPVVDPEDLHILPPGTRLGPYQIAGELGRGGAGVVYLAEDQRLGRQVALKLVASTADPELRDRLRREARAAATIAHPTVATIYALEEFDDQIFIVSEYVRGETLRAALQRGPLPRPRLREIARGIALALRAAHQSGVVHRDLKPENVLLPDTGGVKVVDFGIARITDPATPQLTRHGALLGTPAYMAPEQLLGTAADARADIYAFGIVLTEMLTGRHPGADAVGRDPQRGPAATDAVGRDPQRGPADDDLLAIAQRCTQLDRSARFQDAASLLAAIDNGAAEAVPRPNAHARWWWEFHQVATAVVYGMTAWPAWIARGFIGGAAGRAFFVIVIAAIVGSATLRLHLWFTSRSYPDELDWVRRRSARWIGVADAVFVAALVSGALLIRAEHSSFDVVLLAIGIGAAIAALVIEASTTRAAFRGTNHGTEADAPR